MFTKVLIANRGAIACRIERTLRRLGIKSVAVYSDADRHSLHVRNADESVNIGPAPPTESYLSFDKIIDAVKASGAQAIHPGYGFLSERPEFADRCEREGIVFIGPTSEQMRAFSLKHTARALAKSIAVPLLPGSDLLNDVDHALSAAEITGYPLMLKSTAGGGGIGIRLCRSPEELEAAFDAVKRLGASNFGDGGAFIERYIERARHIEVQIFGDGNGDVLALGERDCSAQRRNQKVIEETPAPNITEQVRKDICESAIRICKEVNYRNAGTVEFVYDADRDEFFFLEVNTRLQVEHGVTEEVTGVDLVEWMVLQASGDLAPLNSFEIKPRGHSIEARIFAEDAGADFQPSSGRLTNVSFPNDARIETWIEPGAQVTPYYDPMVAKVIVYADTRAQALAKMQTTLDSTVLSGIETNLDYLRAVLKSDPVQDGTITTSFLRTFEYKRSAIEIIQGGAQTTVQDYPGRLGYWMVGVPPSGPMDSLAFRLANKIVGNESDAPALEITVAGPEIRFGTKTSICLTGAPFSATLNDSVIPFWTAVSVNPGDVLKIGMAGNCGMRAYLALAGGLDVPDYIGSKSTFMLGNFGGHAGRALRAGDVIHLANPNQTPKTNTFPPELISTYTNAWSIAVLYGPHGAPDFFLHEDIKMLFETDWRVHHQSDRTGTRLIGPKPKWARTDGGEAGLHPSNLHDNAYAVGTIDFTGDMPIILGPDGPSLGGFVCPATIIEADLWKVGQVRPGDTIRFVPVTHEQARSMAAQVGSAIESLQSPLPNIPETQGQTIEPPVLHTTGEPGSQSRFVCRSDGDRNLLVEFGPNVLDLIVRLRVHAVEQSFRLKNLTGIVDITPGIRSMQVHYNPGLISRDAVLEALLDSEASVPTNADIVVPSRIVHLPISWNDPQARLAAEKYMQSTRPDAPWCPDNIEFIRRINGLANQDDVHKIIFDASYFVMGLGDVYLGAPVATPVDPRHRLVTTKYNPARTWTPENAVGIGGAYMCIYGMEGPGGYQLFGRTIQVWNTFKTTEAFEPEHPWLLRFFDQIRFYPVSADELMQMRDGFLYGDVPIKIEPTEFQSKQYQNFLKSNDSEIVVARNRQQQAFREERERWEAAGLMTPPTTLDDFNVGSAMFASDIPEGCEAVRSQLTSSVWKIVVEPGATVANGDTILVLEAMKMEIAVTSPSDGTVEEILVAANALVTPGQTLAIVRPK